MGNRNPSLVPASQPRRCGCGSCWKIDDQKSKFNNPHSAFTLIELLVVLFIIGVLVGLILPAIWQVREAANRGNCAANLRQVAQAVNTYNAQNRRLPYSTFDGPHGDGPNSKSWSWMARLLPYVEQQSIYSLGDIPNKTMQQSGVAGHVVPIFLCPSDSTIADGFRTDAGNMRGMPVGCTSYKGVAGSNWGDDLQGKGRANFRTDWRSQGANGSFDGHSQGDGIFYRLDYKRTTRFEMIRDGISNTFMIGEDIRGATKWSSWPYANNAHGTCAIPPNVKQPDGTDYHPMNWQNNESFRSAHPGGLHFAYADGSVHFIQNSISLPLYRAMATIDGREKDALPH